MGKKFEGVRQRGKTSFLINYRDASRERQFETIRCETIEEAAAVRQSRLGDISKGLQVSSKPNTVLFEELADDVLIDYEHNGFSSLSDITARFNIHILPVFGRMKAAQITTSMLKQYRIERAKEGAAVATINRELEAMRHAYYLAKKATPPKVLQMPAFPIVKERNARKGFFTPEQFAALLRHLPDYLKAPVRFAYITGWRRGEVVELRRRHVDFDAGEVRLEPGETKNEEGRTFPMVAPLRELLRSVWAEHGFPNDYVFTREATDAQLLHEKRRGIQRPRRRAVGEFKKTWATACKAAGLPVKYVPLMRRDAAGQKVAAIYQRGEHKGEPIMVLRAAVHFHDFRRTAYRNLVRLGIPESVAMHAVGWIDPKTAARYNITAKADLDVLRERFDAQEGHKTS